MMMMMRVTLFFLSTPDFFLGADFLRCCSRCFVRDMKEERTSFSPLMPGLQSLTHFLSRKFTCVSLLLCKNVPSFRRESKDDVPDTLCLKAVCDAESTVSREDDDGSPFSSS